MASIRLLVFSTILLGVVYPLLVWMLAHLFFPTSAEVRKCALHGKTVGLYQIGQSFFSDRYFWSRPSAISKKSGPLRVSQASNLSWSSPILQVALRSRTESLIQSSGGLPSFVPDDLVMASASGLDPEISLKAALFQIARVAHARGVAEEEILSLVYQMEEVSVFGLFPRRVNVLKVNCELDRHYP